MTDQEINEAVARRLGVDPEFGCCCLTRPACEHGGNNDYCHSIEAAWEIVEKFDYCYLFRCKGMFEWEWECKLTREDKRKLYGTADTAPMAICLAFLKKVENEQEIKNESHRP